MKEIRLNKLTLKNFKGIPSKVIEPNGKNLDIFGDNATGKTTIYDAFLWLLTGKDSSGRSDFNIKTLDHNGEVIHGLEHVVEADLTVNGTSLSLRKLYKEKWTKKHGESQKLLTGHTTEYWIDEVPITKQKDWQSRIKELIDENLLKLITNPMYFNTMLKWEKRREMLLEMSGDVADADVIASDKELTKLTNILKDKSTDDYKKIVKAQIKKLNEDIEQIPTRIDELTATLGGESVDYIAVEATLDTQKIKMTDIEKELLSANAVTDKFKERQKKLNSLYSTMRQKRAELTTAANSEYDKATEDIKKLRRAYNDASDEIERIDKKITSLRQTIADNEQAMVNLRAEWKTRNAEEYVAPADDALTCPTCGQGLPSEQIEEIVTSSKEKFEQKKKTDLAEIQTTGKDLGVKNAKLTNKIDDMSEDSATKQAHKELAGNSIKALEETLNQPKEEVNLDENPEVKEIQEQIDYLESQLNEPVEDASTALLERKQGIQSEIDRLKATLNNKEVREKTEARIKELKADERKLAQQISEFEGHQFLLEQFTKAKVGMVETSINSMFKTIQFKLFDIQINEGVKECCETMVNTNGAWVPFSDANNAARINAGLDVINTAGRHYDVLAPIFVDNAEAVNELLPINSQVIRLVVSKDKQLRTVADDVLF